MGSYEEGAAMRRRVLGDEHVDRATAETDGLDFSDSARMSAVCLVRTSGLVMK